jgi:cytochrome d ubiquinol oxidase subunit I
MTRKNFNLILMVNIFEQWFDIPESSLRGLSEIGITTHWIILQYSIGLLTLAIGIEIVAYRFEDEIYMQMSKTLSRVAIVIFAVGAATGTLSEFGLLLFWPNFLELVGKYYFIPLYLEVFAFFAEVVFVYLYYYTWDTVSRRFHIAVGIFALVGVFASSMLIMAVNTMMSYPPGILETYDPSTGTWVEPAFLLYLPEGGSQTFTSSELRALINSDVDRYHAILGATVDEVGVFGIVFQSPGAFVSGLHAIASGIIVTLYTTLGVYFWRFMKYTDELSQRYYYKGIKALTVLGGIFLVIQGIIGHFVAENMAKYNPEKLSAIEGNSSQINSFTDIPVIDKILNYLAYGDFDANILPYESIPADYQAPLILFYVYYTKMILAVILFIDTVLLMWYIFKKPQIPRWLMKMNLVLPLIVQVISNFGWIAREAGRKPWTIYGVQTVDEASRQTPLPTFYVIGVIAYSLTLLIGLGLLVRYLFKMKPAVAKPEEKETDIAIIEV